MNAEESMREKKKNDDDDDNDDDDVCKALGNIQTSFQYI